MNAKLIFSVLITGPALATVLFFAGASRADDAEDKAVQCLEKLGAKIVRDEKADGKPIFKVEIRGAKITDEALKELVTLKQLQKLDLAATKVTDAGLKDLTGGRPFSPCNLCANLGRLTTRFPREGTSHRSRRFPFRKNGRTSQ